MCSVLAEAGFLIIVNYFQYDVVDSLENWNNSPLQDL